jgi:hypothetical protein
MFDMDSLHTCACSVFELLFPRNIQKRKKNSMFLGWAARMVADIENVRGGGESGERGGGWDPFFLNNTTTSCVQKVYVEKLYKALQKNDIKANAFFLSHLFYRVFGSFSVRGVRKHQQRNRTKNI